MTEPTKDLISVQSRELVKEALDFCSSITEIVITTKDEYLSNCDLTKKVTKYSKDIEKERKVLLKPLNEQKDVINNYFKTAQGPLNNLKEKLRKSLSDYTEDQKQKRLEAQRKADKEAEKERLKLEKQAKKDAEKSQEAAEKGDHTKAEDYHLRSEIRQDMAEKIEPAEVHQETPKVEGISYREDWSAQVIDKKKFAEYCVQHDKLDYLEINMKLLNTHAKAFKDKLELPGVEISSDTTTVTKT